MNSLASNRTWNRHGIKIVWAISMLFFVLILAFIGYSEYQNQEAKKAHYAPQTLAPLAKRSGPSYNVNEIVTANLFGDPRPAEVITQNIPKTNLNLKLIGVLWASDKEMARVIIQSGNKKPGLYKIGQDIKGAGASVKEIHDHEILISRNGATEKLPLIKAESKGGKDILTYQSGGVASGGSLNASLRRDAQEIGRSSSPKPISPNGDNRKIRKPNFSGLDRALQKMGEI